MAVAVVTPVTATDNDESVVVPLPSWPEELLPQHCTVPPDNNAHECSLPAVMAVAVVTPVTATGTDEFVMVPLPS